MKKWISLLLTVLMLTSLCACAKSVEEVNNDPQGSTSATEQTDSAEEPAVTLNIDTRLVGEWSVVSVEENGLTELNVSPQNKLVFLFDGRYYGSIFGTGTYYPAGSPGIFNCDENQLFLPEILAANPSYSLTFEYSFQEIPESSDLDQTQAKYAAKYADDQLTIKITGENQVSPTVINTVDTTVVLEKVYPLWDEILEPLLIGNWSDNYGNIWMFQPDEYGEVESFSLTTSDKTEYIGEYVLVTDADDEDCTEWITFTFEDSTTDIYEAKIISFDGDILTIEQENGSELILTRTK